MHHTTRDTVRHVISTRTSSWILSPQVHATFCTTEAWGHWPPSVPHESCLITGQLQWEVHNVSECDWVSQLTIGLGPWRRQRSGYLLVARVSDPALPIPNLKTQQQTRWLFLKFSSPGPSVTVPPQSLKISRHGMLEPVRLETAWHFISSLYRGSRMSNQKSLRAVPIEYLW